jgi:hypothetical protein
MKQGARALRRERSGHLVYGGAANATDSIDARRMMGRTDEPPSPALRLAPPIDSSLELALVHLRAALDSETLSLAVELLLRALSSLRHGPPFKLRLIRISLGYLIEAASNTASQSNKQAKAASSPCPRIDSGHATPQVPPKGDRSRSEITHKLALGTAAIRPTHPPLPMRSARPRGTAPVPHGSH